MLGYCAAQATRPEMRELPLAPVRVALVAVRSANNIPSWRGVLRSLAAALQAQGAEVHIVEQKDTLVGKLFALKQAFIRRIIGRKYQRHREPAMLGIYGRRTAKVLAQLHIDAAIALKAIPMAAADTAVPLILYNDAPFGALRDFYAEFTGLSAASIRHGEAAEHAAAQRAAHSVYSSQWGANVAMNTYGVPPEKVSVIEMGANLSITHGQSAIAEWIEQRNGNARIDFLWLGIDWERKGGSHAVAIVQELRRRGFPVHLTVAGVAAAGKPQHDFISYVKFLDKTAIAEQLQRSHFLLLPTRADCTPIVYNEASAFGVPVLSTNVGGIETSIRPGFNGLLFDINDGMDVWADGIARYLADPAAYRQLALASFHEYSQRLNWDVAAAKIMLIIDQLVPLQSRRISP